MLKQCVPLWVPQGLSQAQTSSPWCPVAPQPVHCYAAECTLPQLIQTCQINQQQLHTIWKVRQTTRSCCWNNTFAKKGGNITIYYRRAIYGTDKFTNNTYICSRANNSADGEMSCMKSMFGTSKFDADVYYGSSKTTFWQRPINKLYLKGRKKSLKI